MNRFILLATPWWVNLLVLIPVGAFVYSRNHKFFITKRQLIVVAIFGITFGFVEASVVIYLRTALGLLPGYMGTLSDIVKQSVNYDSTQMLSTLPTGLFTVEFFREAATMIMLISIALIAARKFKEQCAIFLWAFAFWDLFYYIGLWLITRWPTSLTTPDVLFLIPVPWFSQVWFPLLVSGLTIFVIAINSNKPRIVEK